MKLDRIGLIIRREYLTRVRKKSFIIMTFLGPVLIAGLYGLAIWLAIKGDDFREARKIAVLDPGQVLEGAFASEGTLEFYPVMGAEASWKDSVLNGGYDYLLTVGAVKDSLSVPELGLYGKKQASLGLEDDLQDLARSHIRDQRLIALGLDAQRLGLLDVKVSVRSHKLTDAGEEATSAGLSTAIGMIGSILIYISIFLYGVQVMRGVIEEKVNRIMEVIISSVKPMELMMGKILGVAAVGLTQLLLWVVLTTILTTGIGFLYIGGSGADAADTAKMMEQVQQMPGAGMGAEMGVKATDQAPQIMQVMSSVMAQDWGYLLGVFFFYFVFGYLLYSALFGAIGSAVDSESETQQFMLPVTIPLIFSFVVAQTMIVNNPDGPVAFWMSMIPFCAPVVMMVRLPFGVPGWELALSMALMVAGFIGTVWLGGKIYRTGILMYGKKITWKEMAKWLR